jgi:hypothetical protein
VLSELAVDTGATSVVPTITISDAESEKPTNGEASASPEPEAELPGALPESAAPTIPDWYKVGWRAVGGIDDNVAAEGVARDKFILAQFVDEQYYGDWYHNGALIFFVRDILAYNENHSYRS